jgi:hypothetical protein
VQKWATMNSRARNVLATVSCLLALGCGTHLPSPASKPVGAPGGTVATSDGTSVSIPPGALASNVTVTVTPTPGAAAPAKATEVGTPFTFGPEGQTFTVPVTVTLAFDPGKLTGGRSASDIVIFTAPAGSSSYTALGTQVVDATHVSAATTHFSTFVAGSSSQCHVSCGASGSSGTPNCGPGQTCNQVVGCSCYATCNADGSEVTAQACGTADAGAGVPNGGPSTGGSSGSGDAGSINPSGGCNTLPSGAHTYALNCTQASGATSATCTCTTDGTTTASPSSVSCSESAAQLVSSYQSACSYPGLYVPAASSTTSGGADGGTPTGMDGGVVNGGPDAGSGSSGSHCPDGGQPFTDGGC